jgi:hypothetical protein
MEIFISAAVIAAVITAVAAWAVQKGLRSASFQSPDCLPYSKRKFFFSAAERSFYKILRRITPDHTVFAKVRLCDVISVRKGTKTWQTSQNRIQSKHLDFVICDATMAPVVAIELDDSSHARADRKAPGQFVDAALAAAAVPIVHISLSRSYALEDIRRLIFPHLSGVGLLC